MVNQSGKSRSLLLVLVAGLLAATTYVVAVGTWADRSDRATGPEATLAAYSAAVAEGNLQAALQQLLPEAREAAAGFVEWELGNQYVVLESAVRSTSTLRRWSTGGAGDDEVRIVVVMEVQPAVGDRWRTTEEIPAARVNDRWLLVKPPLQPAG